MPKETSLIIEHNLWDAIMHETLKFVPNSVWSDLRNSMLTLNPQDYFQHLDWGQGIHNGVQLCPQRRFCLSSGPWRPSASPAS